MSNQESDFNAFLAGFLVGGLVGAAVALLMAPQSGEETRTVIRDRSIELKDLAAERAEQTRSQVTEKAEQAKEAAASQAEVVREKATSTLEDVKTKATGLADTTRQKASEIQQQSQLVLEEQRGRITEAIDKGKKAAVRKKEDLEKSVQDAADTIEETSESDSKPAEA